MVSKVKVKKKPHAINIEIVNKVENNQQSKNKYPDQDREIEENYEAIENNQKQPYSTPIYELMRPNINTMRNYTLDNTERDKIIEEDYVNIMKPSRGMIPETEAGAGAKAEPETEDMAKPFNMNEFNRQFKTFKNDLLYKLKIIKYKYNNFKKLPNVLSEFKEYILDIYKTDNDPSVLDLAITNFAEEVKDQYPNKFN
jgi:hypothetical protein